MCLLCDIFSEFSKKDDFSLTSVRYRSCLAVDQWGILHSVHFLYLKKEIPQNWLELLTNAIFRLIFCGFVKHNMKAKHRFN